jgi:hypothetical protein
LHVVKATYSSDPASSELDLVRLEIGDTDMSAPHLGDPEIEHFIALEPNAYFAAARAAEAIAAKFAACVDESGGGISRSNAQVYEHYMALAGQLRLRGSRSSMRMTAASEDEKRADAQDADLVQPYFRRGQHDNPRSGLDEPESPLEGL